MISTEEALIGALIIAPEWTSQCAAEVSGDAFADRNLGEVYDAMVAIVRSGAQLDLTLLCSHLGPTKLQSIGGVIRLTNLVNDTVTPSLAPSYAEQIADASRSRSIKQCAERIAASDDPSEHVDEFIRLSASTSVHAKHVTHGISDMIKRATSGKSHRRGVPAQTGDLHLHPELTVLGAKAGCGKSTLALCIAAKVAESSRVVYLTLEDDLHVVQARMLAAKSGLRLRDIRDCMVTDNRSIDAAAVELAKLQLFVLHEPGLQASKVPRVLTHLKFARKADLIIIDYLSRIGIRGKDVFAETQKVCRMIADYSQKLGVPVLLIHHLRKQLKGSEQSRPTLDDLRYAGVDEARQVWLLHRNVDPDTDTGVGSDMELIVAKNNNGPLGKVMLKYDLRSARIGEA